MFWTDYGDDSEIERATLAGQERTAIIADTIITRLKYPNDVLIDQATFLLFILYLNSVSYSTPCRWDQHYVYQLGTKCEVYMK